MVQVSSGTTNTSSRNAVARSADSKRLGSAAEPVSKGAWSIATRPSETAPARPKMSPKIPMSIAVARSVCRVWMLCPGSSTCSTTMAGPYPSPTTVPLSHPAADQAKTRRRVTVAGPRRRRGSWRRSRTGSNSALPKRTRSAWIRPNDRPTAGANRTASRRVALFPLPSPETRLTDREMSATAAAVTSVHASTVATTRSAGRTARPKRHQARSCPSCALCPWRLLSSGTGTAGTNAPIQPDQHFRIASQTKSFTAAVVLQLVDEGKVDLDTPIEQYLPGVVDGNGYDGGKISVRELLRHAGGIAAAEPASFLTTTLAQVVQTALSNHPPVSAPGTQLVYSNIDYWILGMLIEKITGMSARDAITDRIITPLALTQTRFPAAGDLSVGAPAVHGYANLPFVGWTDISNINGTIFGVGLIDEPSEWSTAGAMISTLTDLTTFYQALVDGKVISAASLAQMETPTPLPGNGQNYYGLGLMRLPLSCGGNAWGHTGDLNDSALCSMPAS